MLGKKDPLGKMRLKDESEGALGTDAVDVGAQVGPKSRVIHPRQETVELVSHVR